MQVEICKTTFAGFPIRHSAMVRYPVLLLAVAVMFVPFRHAYPQGAKFNPMRQAAEEPVAEAQPTRPAFRGYGANRRTFTDICEWIGRDGRLDAFVGRLEPHIGRDEGCESCRPLLKGLRDLCTIALRAQQRAARTAAPRPESDEEEGSEDGTDATPLRTPAKIAPRRQPATELLDAVSTLGDTWRADERAWDMHHRALMRLMEILRDRSTGSIGEHEYFDTLCEYWSAAFSDLEPAPTPVRSAVVETPRPPTPSADDLFDF